MCDVRPQVQTVYSLHHTCQVPSLHSIWFTPHLLVQKPKADIQFQFYFPSLNEVKRAPRAVSQNGAKRHVFCQNGAIGFQLLNILLKEENRIGIGIFFESSRRIWIFLENFKAEYMKFEVELDVRPRLPYVRPQVQTIYGLHHT